jgi:hypothetical protein
VPDLAHDLPGSGQLTIAEAVGTTPVHRAVVELELAVGAGATALEVDAAAARLSGTFHPRDFEALSGSDKRAQTRSDGEGAVIVELDGRWTVVEIELASGVAGAGDRVELYRLDGDVRSDKPTRSAFVQGRVARFVQGAADAFIEAAQALPQAGVVPFAMAGVAPEGATLGAQLAQPGGELGPQEDLTQGVSAGKVALLVGPPDFTDLRFAVKLEGASLAPAQLSGIVVRARPTGPRVAVALPGADPETFFWQEPGEAPGSVRVEAGPPFAEALQRFVQERLDEEGPPGDEALALSLVVESDAPCRFVFDTPVGSAGLRAPHLTVVDRLAGGEDKLVLRFSEEDGFTHVVPLVLPAGKTVVSASLPTLPDFRDGSAGGGGSGLEAEPGPHEGAWVDDGRWVGTRVTPPTAPIRGLALGALSASPGLELHCEVQADWNGAPSGAVLAAGRLVVGDAGRRRWATLVLPHPVALTPTPVWVLVTAPTGRGVWLAEPGPDPVRVFDRSDGPRKLLPRSAIPGLSPLLVFLAPATAAGSAPPLAVTVDGVEVGSFVPPAAPPVQLAAGRVWYDPAAALHAALAGLPSSPATVEVGITFRASLPGRLTVYPPRVLIDG